jgi:hypothetical protein
MLRLAVLIMGHTGPELLLLAMRGTLRDHFKQVAAQLGWNSSERKKLEASLKYV